MGPTTPLSDSCGREEEEDNEVSEEIDEMHLVDVNLCFFVFWCVMLRRLF
jgi:hypothetical protein